MIALYLLAAHMVGDYILQSRHQATLKLTDRLVRAGHVFTYSLCFVPIAFVYASPGRAVGFLVWLFVLHFATDSRRFRSTLGDVIAWRIGPVGMTVKPKDLWRRDIWLGRLDMPESDVTEMPSTMRWPPPNEWAPMSILIDQTLHVVQLAVLAGLFLR